MLTSEFLRKLKRCNSRIYLTNNGAQFGGVRLAGIWVRKRRKFKMKGRGLTKGAQRLEDADKGHVDIMLSNVPYPEVTEHEILSEDGMMIARKGWRSIVKDCVLKEAFSWEKAKKVFGSSLGEHDWDKLDYYGKEAALKKEAAGKDWRGN